MKHQIALNSIDSTGFLILKEAIKFKSEVVDDKIMLKFSICGQPYQLGPFSLDILKNPKKDELIAEAWIQVFEKFEKDLDKGVEMADIKIITAPEPSKLIL